MHHFEKPARTRVARQSVDLCSFCWINGPQLTLAFQRKRNSRKQLETVGNSRKQSETVGNSRNQSETVGGSPAGSRQNCQSAVFFDKKNCPRKTHFFWRVQRETVGNSWGLYLWLGKQTQSILYWKKSIDIEIFNRLLIFFKNQLIFQ